MRIFKYRTFNKWAKKQNLTNKALIEAVSEIESGLVDADLGGFVYKKRIGLQGQGKRSALRTILIMKINDKVIFVHGFSKGEKDNISKQELEGFKVMAKAILNMDDKQLKTLIEKNKLTQIF